MSTNNGSSDSYHRAGVLPTLNTRGPSLRVMELPHPLAPSTNNNKSIIPPSTMAATLTFRPHLPYPQASSYPMHNSYDQPEGIKLPSLASALGPEILHIRPQDQDNRSDRARYSPVARNSWSTQNPEYVSTPVTQKRPRPHDESEYEVERERSTPRRYRSPNLVAQQYQGAQLPSTSINTHQAWNASSPTSPHIPHGGLPSMRTSPLLLTERGLINQHDRRHLSSFPSIAPERRDSSILRRRSIAPDYPVEPLLPEPRAYPQMLTSPYDPPTNYHQPPTPYRFHQPRGHSFSGPTGSHLQHDRSPFTSNHHAMNSYPSNGHSNYGMNRCSNANKQRKRRGNLPKETTDKLRAWFLSHLHHPYPTEDEKQDLMRQTGLQINQISNWFINARRRQLPAMINSATAEANARREQELEGNSSYSDEGRSPTSEESLSDNDYDGKERQRKGGSV